MESEGASYFAWNVNNSSIFVICKKNNENNALTSLQKKKTMHLRQGKKKTRHLHREKQTMHLHREE